MFHVSRFQEDLFHGDLGCVAQWVSGSLGSFGGIQEDLMGVRGVSWHPGASVASSVGFFAPFQSVSAKLFNINILLA